MCLLIWQPWDKSLPNVLGFFPAHVCHIPSAPQGASHPLLCLVQLQSSADGGGGGSSPSLAVLCLACCWPLAQGPWRLLWSHHHRDWRSWRLFPSVLCLLDIPPFFFPSVPQVRLEDWLWWSSALPVLWVGDPITWSRPVSLILCVTTPSTVLVSPCLPHHLTLRWSLPSAKLGWGMMLCQTIPSKCTWQHFEKM